MPAGLVSVALKDGADTSRTGWFWSDDGLITGKLQPVHVLLNSAGQPIAFGSGTVGATVVRTVEASDSQLATDMAAVKTAVQSTTAADVNLTKVGGTNIATGDGAAGAGTPRFAMATYTEALKTIGLGDKIQVTPTVTNGAYSANDVIGGKLTFANAARASGGSGFIQSVKIGCKAAVAPALELWLFDADPTSTTPADNAAWSLNAADLGKVIGVVTVATGDWLGGGTPNFVRKEFVQHYELGATSLFGFLVGRTGTTLTSTSDIIVTLEVLFDS